MAAQVQCNLVRWGLGRTDGTVASGERAAPRQSYISTAYALQGQLRQLSTFCFPQTYI